MKKRAILFLVLFVVLEIINLLADFIIASYERVPIIVVLSIASSTCTFVAGYVIGKNGGSNTNAQYNA